MTTEQVAEILRLTTIKLHRLEKKVAAIEKALTESSVIYFKKPERKDPS